MPRAAKPRKHYKPRLIHIPVMKTLLTDFEMQLHTSLAVLRSTPTQSAFNAIADIMDVIGVTMERLKIPDIHDSYRIIQSGASAMRQIKGKYDRTGVLMMSDLEFVPIVNAVNACITVLPRLGVTNLYVSMQEIKGGKHG